MTGPVPANDVPANDQPQATPAYRALKAAVIILGILIILGLGALVTGVVMRMSSGHRAGLASDEAFVLPQGAHIEDMTVSGNRLILRLKIGDADEIDIIDVENGKRVARIAAPEPRVPH